MGNIQGYNMFQYCNNNPVNMSDESRYWPKWMKTAAKAVKKTAPKVVSTVKKYIKVLEIAGGAGMMYAGITAITTGNVVAGVALIVYGANHIYSGFADAKSTYKGNKSKVGKNNLIKNGMQKVAGEKAGNTIYNASEFVVSVATLKVPSWGGIAKVNPTTIVNMKFNITGQGITGYFGVHGIKNIFSSGINKYDNVDLSKMGKFVKAVSKFIKIF